MVCSRHIGFSDQMCTYERGPGIKGARESKGPGSQRGPGVRGARESKKPGSQRGTGVRGAPGVRGARVLNTMHYCADSGQRMLT